MDTHEEHLDVTGLNCPMPLIRIRKAVNGLTAGQSLRVCGDDPTFEHSVRDFCAENAFLVEDIATDGRRVTLLIRARDGRE